MLDDFRYARLYNLCTNEFSYVSLGHVLTGPHPSLHPRWRLNALQRAPPIRPPCSMSMALDNPLSLHAPQHACFTTERLLALATSPAPSPPRRACPPHPRPPSALYLPMSLFIQSLHSYSPAPTTVELAHPPCAHITYVFCARLAARRSWRSSKRLERAAPSSCSCLLPPPSATPSPHPLAPSPWVPFRPSPLNLKTQSRANRMKSREPRQHSQDCSGEQWG